MQTRNVGSSSLAVLPFCLGGNVFGWTIDAATSFAVLDAYVGRGFNFIDTADIYSVWKPGNQGGESETIIGQWFSRSGKRNSVVLATKVGMQMTPEKKGLSRRHIVESVEGSLKRLQTDYIDCWKGLRKHFDPERRVWSGE